MLLNLVAEQIKMGLKPTIASIGEKGIAEKPLETEALERGFAVKKFRMIPGPNSVGAFEVLRYARQGGFDLMHSHGYKGNIMFGLMPRRLRGIPIVTTLHGYTSTGNGFNRMRLYEWLDSLSLKYIDAVVLVSKAMKSNFRIIKLDQTNVHVIHNGIPIQEERFEESTHQSFNDSTTQQFILSAIQSKDLANQAFNQNNQSLLQFNNLVNQPFNQYDCPPSHLLTLSSSITADLDQYIIGFCQQGFTIGSIGRLSPEKGYIYLIEAIRKALDSFEDLRLVIIGEGGDRKLLERKIAGLKLQSHVLLPGYQKYAKKYLKYFDAFVISSLTEGLPISLLEAMQARVPIISTRVGGIPEVLENGEAGLLVDSGKISELRDAITETRKNKGSVSYRTKKAASIIGKKYSSHMMAKRYLEVYQSVKS